MSNEIRSRPGAAFAALIASRRLQWAELHEPSLRSSTVFTSKVAAAEIAGAASAAAITASTVSRTWMERVGRTAPSLPQKPHWGGDVVVTYGMNGRPVQSDTVETRARG